MPMDNFELQEAMGKLLPSQQRFIFAPEVYSCLDGGWGSGKSRALCVKSLVLSAAIPGNVGLIGRLNATDLEDSTMQVFWEVCPPSWIHKYNKTKRIVTFRNGSMILFRHIADPNPKKKHITSMNLGFFAVDQAEEIDIEHWNTLTGRLRLPRAPKRFGFLAANPNGKDWIYKMFFQPGVPIILSPFSTAYAKGDRVGIAVKSLENTKANGGFVDDDFFERLRNDMPAEWVARFLDCSFEDFSGKIYKEFSLDSIHIIEAFRIPKEWDTIVPIDVGGDVPWGIPILRVDPYGNIIQTDEFYRPTVTSSTVAHFIKQNSQWQAQNFTPIIDPENKVAMIELQQDHDIHCRPAIKAVRPGIIQTGGYLHINPTHKLPPWYETYQPKDKFEKFKDHGSPKYFVFRACKNTIHELDEYAWDPKRPGHPIKKNDHLADAIRYACMFRPSPSDVREEESPQLAQLRVDDPLSYNEWREFDKRMKARENKRKGNGIWTETGIDETGRVEEQQLLSFIGQGHYDYGDGS